MCIGEMGCDTIDYAEREHLRIAAEDAFPAHDFEVQANNEGMIWVVLEPAVLGADLLRFTICRIAPCLLVLAEDQFGRRQICSTQGVADAIAFARSATDQAVVAAAGTTPVLH